MYIESAIIDWNRVSEESYLRGIGALSGVGRIDFRKAVTFFVGENGSGKSTMLEAIALAYGFNPEGGTLNYLFSTFDDYSELCNATKLVKGVSGPRRGFFLRAESFYNVQTKSKEYESYDGKPLYGPRTLHEQSHGESFMNFITTFGSPGIFLMDEPEAALSPARQLALFTRIAEMARKGAQYIIVTHSPILLGLPDADILVFDDAGIAHQAYEDTESYRITEMFINHRDAIVGRLMGE